MVDAHSHLELTSGCGEAEIQEVVCVLVSLRDQVVIDADKEIK
jgi:hypothetical protein